MHKLHVTSRNRPMPWRRLSLPLAITALAAIASGLSASPIISYTSSNIGDLYQFSYHVDGFSFLMDEELDLIYDPSLFGVLSNAGAPAGFNVLVFQPNQPPGSDGVFSSMATMDNPPLIVDFTINATYLGMGTPAPINFEIYDFVVSSVPLYQGVVTTASQVNPEPSTASLVTCFILLAAAAFVHRRLFRFRH